jgi:hypothetical protein
MSDSVSYPLRLPKSLKEKVTEVARRDGTSLNQFIAIAVAEKLSVMEAEQYFVERAQRADREEFRSLLFRKGGQAPQEGDEIHTKD